MVAQGALGLRLAQYRANQLDIYERGMLRNEYPRVTTETARIVEQAKQRLSAAAFNYCEAPLPTTGALLTGG